jgi:hypothetical protein
MTLESSTATTVLNAAAAEYPISAERVMQLGHEFAAEFEVRLDLLLDANAHSTYRNAL